MCCIYIIYLGVKKPSSQGEKGFNQLFHTITQPPFSRSGNLHDVNQTQDRKAVQCNLMTIHYIYNKNDAKVGVLL
jgi:hypothetical protein